MFLYIAIHKDENTGYGVTVPSLPGCFSYGDTLEQAIEESKQAILFHIEGLLADGIKLKINQPNFVTLFDDPENADALWFGIDVNIDHLIPKPEQFNVRWTKYLLNKIDNYLLQIYDLQIHNTQYNFFTTLVLKQLNSFYKLPEQLNYNENGNTKSYSWKLKY